MHRSNALHYPDPTAVHTKPCVFICSPFAGNIQLNTKKAKRYMRFAAAADAIPFAPHLLYPQVFEDSDPKQRELGLCFGLVWLGKCDEIWVFGNAVSSGMLAEIDMAKRSCIPIRYFTENGKEADKK